MNCDLPGLEKSTEEEPIKNGNNPKKRRGISRYKIISFEVTTPEVNIMVTNTIIIEQLFFLLIVS